jgi:hypothetical protein
VQPFVALRPADYVARPPNYVARWHLSCGYARRLGTSLVRLANRACRRIVASRLRSARQRIAPLLPPPCGRRDWRICTDRICRVPGSLRFPCGATRSPVPTRNSVIQNLAASPQFEMASTHGPLDPVDHLSRGGASATTLLRTQVMYAASWRIVRFRTDRVTKTRQSWSIYLWREQGWRSPLRHIFMITSRHGQHRVSPGGGASQRPNRHVTKIACRLSTQPPRGSVGSN